MVKCVLVERESACLIIFLSFPLPPFPPKYMSWRCTNPCFSTTDSLRGEPCATTSNTGEHIIIHGTISLHGENYPPASAADRLKTHEGFIQPRGPRKRWEEHPGPLSSAPSSPFLAPQLKPIMLVMTASAGRHPQVNCRPFLPALPALYRPDRVGSITCHAQTGRYSDDRMTDTTNIMGTHARTHAHAGMEAGSHVNQGAPCISQDAKFCPRH